MEKNFSTFGIFLRSRTVSSGRQVDVPVVGEATGNAGATTAATEFTLPESQFKDVNARRSFHFSFIQSVHVIDHKIRGTLGIPSAKATMCNIEIIKIPNDFYNLLSRFRERAKKFFWNKMVDDKENCFLSEKTEACSP
ncbi:hypothetical protein V1477_002681 [Vespula maculifrons]|uniref:Uncharacterized protein n=1 Tax=Vespula maculifrons TaxID=7453 RepID=A0ABD2CVP0_VESMC